MAGNEVEQAIAQLNQRFPGFKWEAVKRGKGMQQLRGVKGLSVLTVALLPGEPSKWRSRLDHRETEIIASFGGTAVGAVDRLLRRMRTASNLITYWDGGHG
jgi:hypothetical protein